MLNPELQSEERIMASAFTWAWNTYPQTRRCLFHVPNELDRLPGETKQNHIRRLTQAKAKGVVPGIWDVIFFWKSRVYAIEFKCGRNNLSEAQKLVGEVWVQHGVMLFTVWSVDEFQIIFKNILDGKY